MWSYYGALLKNEGCVDLLRDTSEFVSFPEFQASFAGHHWSSTWHETPLRSASPGVSGVPILSPHLLAWLGHNRSAICKEARFDELIQRTWLKRRDGDNCVPPSCVVVNRVVHTASAARRPQTRLPNSSDAMLG